MAVGIAPMCQVGYQIVKSVCTVRDSLALRYSNVTDEQCISVR